MGFFSRKPGGNKPAKRSKKEILQLKDQLEKGIYYDAYKAAKELVDIGDYSCMDIMISRMEDHRMAEPLSRIPDEAVIMPLILAISKYAILSLYIANGSEKFDARSASYIFKNLVRNFQDQVYAYIAEISDYHFFYMKDDVLFYTVGSRSFTRFLNRQDLIAGSARDAIADVPRERIQEALDREKTHYQYDTMISSSEIQNIVREWKPQPK